MSTVSNTTCRTKFIVNLYIYPFHVICPFVYVVYLLPQFEIIQDAINFCVNTKLQLLLL